MKPPPASEEAKPPSWFDRYVQLHQALGLNAEEAIEDHCRAWVEMTTARALGKSLVEVAIEKVNDALKDEAPES